MRPASWSAGIPARIDGVTSALPKTDQLWRRVPVGLVWLTDRAGHRRFARAGKDARGPGICAFQSPSGVLGVCRSGVDWLMSDYFAGFQSPSGVLGVCRDGRLAHTRTALPRFSPLAGF